MTAPIHRYGIADYGDVFLYRGLSMIEGYTIVKDMAEKWGITPRTVQILCAEGKIEGVTKFGKAWAIPVNAIKPTDNRVTTGEYVNWRKQSKDKAADDYKIPR